MENKMMQFSNNELKQIYSSLVFEHNNLNHKINAIKEGRDLNLITYPDYSLETLEGIKEDKRVLLDKFNLDDIYMETM